MQNLLPSGSEKKLAGELKKIRRAAGIVRDVDVQIKLVDEFDSPQSTRSPTFVRASLDQMRARSEKKLIQLLAPDELKDLQRMPDQCQRKLLNSSKRQANQPDRLASALEQYSPLLGRFEPRNGSEEVSGIPADMPKCQAGAASSGIGTACHTTQAPTPRRCRGGPLPRCGLMKRPALSPTYAYIRGG